MVRSKNKQLFKMIVDRAAHMSNHHPLCLAEVMMNLIQLYRQG
jgi:hypothetical protein